MSHIINNHPSKKSGLRLRLQILSILSLIGLSIGQFGQLYWVFDLFSHFTWCYLVGFLLGIWAFRKIVWQALMGSLLLAMIFWSMHNVLMDKPPQATPTGLPIQLMAYNLKFDSFESAHQTRVIELMDEMSNVPSIVLLSEYSSDFDNVFKATYEGQYQCAKPEDSPFGIALYSTLNDLTCTIDYPDGIKFFPYIRAESDEVVVYGIHPPPPISQEMADFRDHTFNVIAGKVRQETKPVIVMGDMNISPYSPVFRRFVKEAGLYETKNRLIPTWLVGMLNIDHILVTHPNQENSRAGWWRGSDHRPVFLEY